MQCQNSTKGEYFCSRDHLTEWLQNNFVFSITCIGGKDRGYKCKKCDKMISLVYGDTVITYQTINEKDIPKLVEHSKVCEGKQKASKKTSNENSKSSKWKEVCERIFNKSPMANGTNGYHFQNEKGGKWVWCGGTPIWLKYCDKEDAQALKSLLKNGQVWGYHRWLSKSYDDFKVYDTIQVIGKSEDEFIRELDEIINSDDSELPPPYQEKPNNEKPNHIPIKNPHECCESCGISCIIHQDKDKGSYTIRRKRYIKHKTDFTREFSCWFGTNCECARKFREANQQACPQCKKREFPHMKKGWLLDYEIKQAFCSPLCHVTYRELKWEEANRLTQIEMFPPELEVSANPSQTNLDWEQEGLRNEVLFLRETNRELETRLANQSNLTPEEKLQNSYLLNLQQNTLRSAETTYQNKYGALTEGNSKPQGRKFVPLIMIGAIILLPIGMIIFLIIKNRKIKKNPE